MHLTILEVNIRSDCEQNCRAKLSTLAPKVDAEPSPLSTTNAGCYESPYCTYYYEGNDAEYILNDMSIALQAPY